MIFLGVDPGESGAFGVVGIDGSPVTSWKFKEQTERDIWDAMKEFTLSPDVGLATLEQVNAMPKQGVSSSFKFGQSYGVLRGLLAASAVPYELVRPQAWQGLLQCRTGGDKNISKAKAQQLFPGVKITHANADALLLAEYARRMWISRQAAASA